MTLEEIKQKEPFFGKWTIVEKLGAGSYGDVYKIKKCDYNGTEYFSALKVISLPKDEDERAEIELSCGTVENIREFYEDKLKNLQTEIELMSQFKGKTNIVSYEDHEIVPKTGEPADGFDVFVRMELLEDLRYIQLSRPALLNNQIEIIRIGKDICTALEVCRSHYIIHRDIKPGNIMRSKDGDYKLGDFGIARFVGDGDAETVVFTDGYGAPEIERQLAESYNLTADIYSLGITLFLLLNGLKFPASDGYHANIAQYTKDFIVPAPSNSSEEMARIIRKMCSYQVKDRYQSVEEVLMEIGRIDGSYTDRGFTEYEDLETETYSEIDDLETETYKEPDESSEQEKTEENEEIPWWRKDDSELTREERKKKIQSENESYTSSSIWRMIITALLTVLLLKSFSPNAAYVSRWEFWILPIAVFVEAILQRVKEFHAEFGFVTVGIAVFSMYYLGIDVPQIVPIVAVIMGIPAITAGVSIGMGLWIAQMLTGKLAWLSVFSKWDLGWIVLILFAAVIESYILFRADYRRANNYEAFIISWIMDKIWILMIIAGIILLLLGHFKVIIIPEIVKHIHLVRTGIGFYIVELFYMWYYGLFDDEKADIDEPLDE